MRRIATDRLQSWIEEHGDGALGELEKLTGLSFHTLYKMATGGYRSEPSKATRRLLSKATGLKEDDLFPVTREKAS